MIALGCFSVESNTGGSQFLSVLCKEWKLLHCNSDPLAQGLKTKGMNPGSNFWLE